jgi:hypothetical protein
VLYSSAERTFHVAGVWLHSHEVCKYYSLNPMENEELSVTEEVTSHSM